MIFSIGQKAFIVNGQKKVLIIKRDRADGKIGFWDLPGGRVNAKESLRQALTREVFEETGLIISKIFQPISITTFFSSVDHLNQVVRIIYICEAKGKTKTSLEHNKFMWINPKHHLKYNFPDEDYHQAFQRFLNKMSINQDFLGKGMLEESLQLLKK